MIYAWVEDGHIFAVERLEDVPQQYRNSVTLFEDFDFRDVDKLYVDENGEIKVKSEEQILVEKKRMLLESLRQEVFLMLSQTDWVLIKCGELGINPNDLYPDVMSERKKIRELNDELEKKIKEAKTLQKLEEIEWEVAKLG